MKKGSTLVEVMVALAILAIATASLVAGYFSINNVQMRQKEYLYFEGVCLDVDKFYDEYGVSVDGIDGWDKHYFADGFVNAEGVQDNDGVVENATKWFVYYTADFQPCKVEDKEKIAYVVEFWYEYDGTEGAPTTESSLVLRITDYSDSSRVIVDNCNYGVSSKQGAQTD